MMYSQARRVTCARGLFDSAVDVTPARNMVRHQPIQVERSARSIPSAVTDHRLVETLTLLEAAAIALGATELSAQGFGIARAAGQELRECHRDPGTAARWARLFHQTLLDACPNRHMLAMIEHESRCGRPLPLPLSVEGSELTRVADDHEALLELIAEQAPRAELERALRLHARRSALCSLVPLAH